MFCLLISGCRIGILLSETFSLIDRIVQLRVGVCHLPAVHEEFKTFYIVGIVRFFLCKRRNLDRMIHNKSRLDQVFLYIFLKEQIQDIPFSVSVFEFNLVFFCKCSGLLEGLHFIPVNSCIFLHCVYHGDPLKRLAQIHLHAIVNDLSSSQDFLGHMAVKIFCKIHHAVVVCICLIQLHKSKLRIMSGIQTFVTEYSSDLVNSFQTAYDQPL